MTCAALSPDGSQIAFFRELPARELWIMSVAGEEPHVRFTLGEDEHFLNVAWSPDGKSIAYIRDKERLIDYPGILEIRSLEDGKSRVLLTDQDVVGGGDNGVWWLRDGRILFGVFKEGSITESDLWELSLDSSGAAAGKPVRLTNTTGLHILGLTASADGKRLAILSVREPFALWVANLNSTGDKLEQPLRLTNDSWRNRPEIWTQDSQTLFYGSIRGKRSIYKRRMSWDSAELFLAGPEDYSLWGQSPNGMWFIVTASRTVPGKWRLLRVPVSGGTPETILTPAGVAEVHCGTGSHICVLSEDVAEQKVFSVVDAVRGRLQELTRIGLSKENIQWSLSPDGSKIALVEWNSDNVRVLDLNSKQVQVIHPTPPQKMLQMPAWSADGERLFLSGFADDKGRLLEMDVSGNTHLLLENPAGWLGCPVPSPDGKRLAYSYVVRESNVTLLEHF